MDKIKQNAMNIISDDKDKEARDAHAVMMSYFQQSFALLGNVIGDDNVPDQSIPELQQLQDILRKMRSEFLQVDKRTKQQQERHNIAITGIVANNLVDVHAKFIEYTKYIEHATKEFSDYVNRGMIGDICKIETIARVLPEPVAENAPNDEKSLCDDSKNAAITSKEDIANKIRTDITFKGETPESAAEKHGIDAEEAKRMATGEDGFIYAYSQRG